MAPKTGARMRGGPFIAGTSMSRSRMLNSLPTVFRRRTVSWYFPSTTGKESAIEMPMLSVSFIRSSRDGQRVFLAVLQDDRLSGAEIDVDQEAGRVLALRLVIIDRQPLRGDGEVAVGQSRLGIEDDGHGRLALHVVRQVLGADDAPVVQEMRRVADVQALFGRFQDGGHVHGRCRGTAGSYRRSSPGTMDRATGARSGCSAQPASRYKPS